MADMHNIDFNMHEDPETNVITGAFSAPVRLGLGARLACASVLTLCSFCVPAQSDTREFPVDTTITERHYTLAVANGVGQLIAFGNRDKAGEGHGWWYEYAPDSTLVLLSEYHHGSMVHTQWGKGEVVRYDKKGNIISKGKAQRKSHPF